MPPLPSAVRAALGLAATVVDEARTLPDKAIELPMLAVSKTLQLSLRAQRTFAALASRGDEVLASRHISDEAPAWATFDAPVDSSSETAVAGPAEPAEGSEFQQATSGDTPPAHVSVSRPARRAAKRSTKAVRAPRNGAPSPFDSVVDD